ncbi:MAG: hypothetical protein ACJ04P_13015 [Halioglobus sp.]
MTAEKDKLTEAAKAELLQAWDGLIDNLQKARDVIDNPALFGPAATPHVLAEGYRYLAGFIHHGIERSFHEDANFPAFRNALSVYNKSTIENPDAIYFYAPIDGSKRYRITAQLPDYRHWRGEAPAESGPIAAQYLLFETSTAPMSGDTGNLAELAKGFRTSFGTLDSSEIQISDSGEIELLLGPEKPEGYTGDFICTRKPPSKNNPDGEDRYANYLSGRQIFLDWEREIPIELKITALDYEGDHPAALTPASASQHLNRMGSVIEGQMRFWMDFYDKVLNSHGSYPADGGPYFFPINAYNEPNAPSQATGGGMSTNISAGGIFELGADEALYIEACFVETPLFSNCYLNNLWGESADYSNHQSSLNLTQMHMGTDKVQRWVIAHKDPGIQNWLDTTGIEKGFIANRWVYSEFPDQADWPKIFAKKISFSEIDAHMPDDMPRVTPEQRKVAISIRQAHVKRRFRVF